MIPEEEFKPILEEIRRQAIYQNPDRILAGAGRSQVFGVVGRRCLPPDYSRFCWLRPYLYKLLLDFGAKYCPFPFTSITVNQNYQAAPHRDKNNQGKSFLVAFGDYTGGELEILEGENKGILNIRCNPVIDDFSKVLHAVRPFTGERISLVYYTYHHPRPEWNTPIPPPSIREKEGKLLFYRGEECITKGLPHPLRGVPKGEYKKRRAAQKIDPSPFFE